MELAADIAESLASHERLLRTVGRLDDSAVASPSLLPDWTVGMVLTHLARHADGQVSVLRGETTARYPSIEARDAGIEAARGRSADDEIADVRNAISRLEAAYREAEWTGAGER